METLEDRLAPRHVHRQQHRRLRIEYVATSDPRRRHENGGADTIDFDASLAGETITLTSNDSDTAYGPTALVMQLKR